MRLLELWLAVATPIAGVLIMLRAGHIVNRMHWRCCAPLLASYTCLTLCGFLLALIPFYGQEAAALGYPGLVVSAAAVFLLDKRLDKRRPYYD